MALSLPEEEQKRIKVLESILAGQRNVDQKLELENLINRRDNPTQEDKTTTRANRIAELRAIKMPTVAETNELKQLELDEKTEPGVLDPHHRDDVFQSDKPYASKSHRTAADDAALKQQGIDTEADRAFMKPYRDKDPI